MYVYVGACRVEWRKEVIIIYCLSMRSQNGRTFDPYDILSNIVGSVTALALCSWYHKRMLERKRLAKHYRVVPGDDGDGGRDVELGDGGLDHHRSEESGDATTISSIRSHDDVDDEVDGWIQDDDVDVESVPVVENGSQKPLPAARDANG